MSVPAWRMWLAGLALLAFSALYCLPGHLSVGHASGWDALLHVAVFAALGWGLMRWLGRVGPWLALILLGAGLEVLQWRLGGYARLEWGDLVCNEVGVVIAWMASRLQRRAEGLDATAEARNAGND